MPSPHDDCPRELRCSCGRLLVRLTALGVELKCGKCKATQVVPWALVQGSELAHAELRHGPPASLRLAELELEEARCDPEER